MTSLNVLRVTNLTRQVTAAHLREVFGHFGDAARVDPGRRRHGVGLSRGYAVVELASRADAEAAKAALDGGRSTATAAVRFEGERRRSPRRAPGRQFASRSRSPPSRSRSASSRSSRSSRSRSPPRRGRSRSRSHAAFLAPPVCGHGRRRGVGGPRRRAAASGRRRAAGRSPPRPRGGEPAAARRRSPGRGHGFPPVAAPPVAAAVAAAAPPPRLALVVAARPPSHASRRGFCRLPVLDATLCRGPEKTNSRLPRHLGESRRKGNRTSRPRPCVPPRHVVRSSSDGRSSSSWSR